MKEKPSIVKLCVFNIQCNICINGNFLRNKFISFVVICKLEDEHRNRVTSYFHEYLTLGNSKARMARAPWNLPFQLVLLRRVIIWHFFWKADA